MEQRRKGLVMQEPLPRAQTGHELGNGRGNISGVAQAGTRRTDPVLATAELAGHSRIASNPSHEPFMHFANQTQGQGQCFEAIKAVFECSHVVADFMEVRVSPIHGGTSLFN